MKLNPLPKCQQGNTTINMKNLLRDFYNSFLRDIYNASKGRVYSGEKILALDPNLGELRGLLLSDVPGKRMFVNINYRSNGEEWARKEAAIWILQFLKASFRLEDGTYVDAADKVYSGHEEEMHYVTIKKGTVEGNINGEKLKRKPARSASLEFLVSKK